MLSLPAFPKHVWIRIGISLLCALFAVPSFAQIDGLRPLPESTLNTGTKVTITWTYGAQRIPVDEQMIVEYAILPSNGTGIQFFSIALLAWDETQTELNVPAIVPEDARLILRLTETDNAGDGTIIGSLEFLYFVEEACNTPIVEPLNSIVNACVNSKVTIGVKNVPSALAYRWFQRDTLFQTTVVPTVDVQINGEDDFGTYRVEIEDSCGALSDITDVTLIKEHDAPVVTRQPFVTASTVCTGSEVRFGASASGVSLQIQWLKDGQPIDGATAIPYTITNVGKHNQGVYSLRVTGACGFVTVSEDVTLTVVSRPTIIKQPVTTTACIGLPASLSVQAEGTALTYQWRKNGAPINGANGATLTIATVENADLGTYDCVITSLETAPAGCDRTITSGQARLVAARSPVITQQPTAEIACIEESFTMSVKATGTELSFQWYLNDRAIEGQSTATLTIPSVKRTSAGSYYVVVANSCGNSVQSEEIPVVVLERPQFSQQPADVSVVAGGSLQISAKAVRATSVDWYRNGVLVASTADGNLTLENVSMAASGTYSARAQNACGEVVSNRITVTVLPVTEPTPLLSTSSTALDFGTAPIGQRGDTSRTLTLRNTGNAPLAITSIQDASNAPFPFGLADVIVLPISLAPGEQVEIPIAFTPFAVGPVTRKLEIESNDPNGPATVELSGIGRLYYDGVANINFPVTPIGTSFTSCLELTNATDEEITLETAGISGPQAEVFDVESTFPLVLPARGSTQLCTKFTPRSTMTATATVSINSTRGGNATIRVEGNGSGVSSVRSDVPVDVAMAPNPTSGMVTFHVEEPVRIQIATMQGLVVATTAIEGTSTINLADYSILAQGTYAVTVTGKVGSKTLLLQVVN